MMPPKFKRLRKIIMGISFVTVGGFGLIFMGWRLIYRLIGDPSKYVNALPLEIVIAIIFICLFLGIYIGSKSLGFLFSAAENLVKNKNAKKEDGEGNYASNNVYPPRKSR